ncbi:MAG: helix-turn-helix domain-containing protein [Casimicrobiaceae bacterium]
MARELKHDGQGCMLAPALTAEEIKRFREELKLTQEEFSKEFDIPLGTLRGWEQGLHTSRASAFLLRYLREVVRRKPHNKLART